MCQIIHRECACSLQTSCTQLGFLCWVGKRQQRKVSARVGLMLPRLFLTSKVLFAPFEKDEGNASQCRTDPTEWLSVLASKILLKYNIPDLLFKEDIIGHASAHLLSVCFALSPTEINAPLKCTFLHFQEAQGRY